MINPKLKYKPGFTIIELMIATTIFALLMLICMSALVQISRAYYRGITASKTQETARSIVDEITQGIQLSADTILPTNGPTGPQVPPGFAATGFFCIGYRQYAYAIDRQAVSPASPIPADKEIRNALLRRDLGTNCDLGTPVPNLNSVPAAGTRSLVGENMRLSRLVVAPVAGTNGNLWRISVSVVYGDTVLLTEEAGRLVCGSGTGTEFCALSEIDTTVKRRFGGF